MTKITPLEKRFINSIDYFKKHVTPSDVILDLGTENDLSRRIREMGYDIVNTGGQDLDIEYTTLTNRDDISVVTAFEILEHLVSPLHMLKALPGNRLIATVPLRLWFARAYRNKNDRWDQHYHEFEDWQFDWLLEKAGWRITDREKWVSPGRINGIRPLLRRFTHRYYAVCAERL